MKIRSVALAYALLTTPAVAACSGKIGEAADSGNASESGGHTDNQATPDGSDGSDANPTNAGSDGASTLPPPVVLNHDGTIMFVPSLVDATRNPVVCGVQDPPFTSGDQFFLEVTGNAAKPPSNELVVSFNSPVNVTVGAPIMLTVLPYSPQGTKITTPDGGFGLYADQSSESGLPAGLQPLYFTYTQGTDPNEIDMGAFDAVTLTLVAMPLSTSCVNRVLDGGRRVAQTRARECERSISSECAAVPQARAAARSAGRARGRARRGRGEHG